MTKKLCIYHKNCSDGFAAALVLHLVFPGDEIEYYPSHYGDPLPDVKGKDVFILDFSYKLEILLEMQKSADSILLIDHHKTASSLQDLDFVVFDEDKSACVLTWEYFFPTRDIPKFYLYLQDRDLWTRKYTETDLISYALHLEKMEFETWRHFLNGMELSQLMRTGHIIKRAIDRRIEKILDDDDNNELFIMDFEGYEVPCLNNGQNISEIGHALCERYPFVVQYFDVKDKRVFSLRGDGQVDVSEIAKRHGGGGHFIAAGFTMPKPPIF